MGHSWGCSWRWIFPPVLKLSPIIWIRSHLLSLQYLAYTIQLTPLLISDPFGLLLSLSGLAPKRKSRNASLSSFSNSSYTRIVKES